MPNLRTKLTAAAFAVVLAAPLTPTASAQKHPKGKAGGIADTDAPKLTAAQSALVDKAITREAVIIKAIQQRAPVVETYIQNMQPDPVMGQSPESDVHFLGRVNFGHVIGDTNFAASSPGEKGKKENILKHSLGFLTGMSSGLHMTFNEQGFVQMLLLDSNSFNRQMYQFAYVRNDFLGTIPTVVFDVTPSKHNDRGRFSGRIWVERTSGNIVRFNGDFAGSDRDISEYFHFDSWRTNVQEGLWLPTAVYIEETDAKSPTHVLKFKAVSHIWGYSLKVPVESSETNLTVEDAASGQGAEASDLSPLQAQREWVQQAEDNVIDRLFKAGLIDAPSSFDATLEALANNLLLYNKIETDHPIKVRTLLTQPLETLSVGNTILISKSLLDTTEIQSTDGKQAEQIGNLQALLAFQIAHILLGHHIDTKYAFNDRLMFPTEAAFQRLPMNHTDTENAEAAKKAVELLSAPEVPPSMEFFGLYLQQLAQRQKALKSLTDPQMGDGLLKPDGTFWMQAMVGKAPKLSPADLKQQAAMPLSQFTRTDPWTDQVIQLRTSYAPLMSSRDKLPFEITPVYIKLAYWTAPAPPAPADAAPAGAPATPATPTTPTGDATQPAGAAPAPGAGDAVQPAATPQQPGTPQK